MERSLRLHTCSSTHNVLRFAHVPLLWWHIILLNWTCSSSHTRTTSSPSCSLRCDVISSGLISKLWVLDSSKAHLTVMLTNGHHWSSRWLTSIFLVVLWDNWSGTQLFIPSILHRSIWCKVTLPQVINFSLVLCVHEFIHDIRLKFLAFDDLFELFTTLHEILHVFYLCLTISH